MQPLLCATIARALGTSVEVSLRDLLGEYGVTDRDDILTGLSQLRKVMDHYGVTCVPAVGDGSLDDPRVLSVVAADSIDAVLAEIKNLETAKVEFKSSLLVDRNRLERDPGRPLEAYKSEEVIKSSLKTIAAFANSGGGTLYVGVQDDGTLCGLDEDFSAANPKRGDYDGWEQTLRNLIATRFANGAALSAYVHTQLYDHGGRAFVRVQVTGKGRLTFLKTGDAWSLYFRSGTQTNAIPYCDIEQHFVLARLY